MTKGSEMKNKALVASFAVMALALVAVAQPAGAAKAPAGKTYFVVSVGVASDPSEAYEVDVGCVRFSRTEICDTDGDCGSWWRMREEVPLRQQWQVGFEFELIDDETSLPIRINGIGRIDSRGAKSAIAGAAHGVELTSGETINFALAGRAVGAARCERMARDYLNAQR